MRYRIGVSLHAERVEGVAFDLPGCAVSAPDEATLREMLPVAIAEHVAWLADHGEPLDPHGALDVDIVETITRAETTAADGEFCFDDDLRPVADDEIDRAVRHMAYARADLLALVEPLPDAVLDWRPPRSAMAKIDPWNPDVLTIREIVAEIGNSDGYYRTGLQDGEPSSADPEPEGLEARRQCVIERLRSLPAGERGRLFHPVRPWRDSPEDWTARKAVRRIIGHERFHTKEIEQRLAWLLLGVPDFTRARTWSEASVSTA
ncbi:MAG: DinB family protein [Dehalococcoidia bacterium]